MPGKIMTEVSAIVAEERSAEVLEAFQNLLRGALPEGLVRTELLRGQDGEWRIHSWWRDRAALETMRAGSDPPAAPALFRRLGAEPVLRIYQVQASRSAS